ncbi:MAG: MaoC family dehydratase [Thermoplasmatota archaeon]
MPAPRSLGVGDFHEARVHMGDALVAAFRSAVGDDNPLHWDTEFTRGTIFGRPIVHGTLLLALTGKILGMEFPGPGTIYLSHQVRFRRPVYVGSTVVFRLTVKGVDTDRGRTVLETLVVDEANNTCMWGEALVGRSE